jgi:hypothetical protein
MKLLIPLTACSRMDHITNYIIRAQIGETNNVEDTERYKGINYNGDVIY